MGVKERQEREREAVARAILDAARELFVTEGYQNVSIRKIAERIEYSPAAIYGYFPSKDHIFFALAEEGFRLLCGSGHTGTPPDGNPVDAVRQAFWHLYEFSRQHREYFALMFVDRTVPRITQHWDRFSFVGEMKERIATLIQHAVDTGHLPPGTSPHGAFRILTAAVVGAAVMQVCNRIGSDEGADSLARDTLEAALTGLRSGFPLTFRQDPGTCSAPPPPVSE